MAKKLTEQEQASVITLAKILGKELPSQERGNAGGIASGIVRLRKSQVTRDEVRKILAKYGAGNASLKALLRIELLIPSGRDGVYRLVLPAQDETASTKSDKADQRAIAKTERPKPPAKRDTRTLASLDTIRKQSPDLTEIRCKIIELDPRMWINGWLLSTPDAYVRYERQLRALDSALAGNPRVGDGSLSLRELSYQVFGDEKFLSPESDGRKMLHLMGLSDILDCRPQAKLELLHHIPKHRRHLRLVVSENLDPWVNMRNALFIEGSKRLLGERVHGVIFGNGYIIDDPHKLPDLISTLEADEVEVLYWGDIDRAGLQILDKLSGMAGPNLLVRPFVAAYRLMIKRAMKRYPDPLDNEKTDQTSVTVRGLDLFEGELKEKELAYLKAVIDGARLIPQEILTACDL